MKLTKQEKETVNLFNEAGKTAQIETFNGRMIRKLAELSERRPEDCCKLSGPDPDGAYRYTFPTKWIKISAPREARLLSEEEKEEITERLRQARQNRRKG